MVQICKFCGSQMIGEYETLSNSHHYKFFFTCPKCKAVYEGERKEQGKNLLVNNSRWFNPNTNTFE